MRTNIDIDDGLKAAINATGKTSERATVEKALRRAVLAHQRHQALMDMVGIEWGDDAEAQA